MENKSIFNFSAAIGVKAPPSPWLIFHVHGGGFVAQSRCVPATFSLVAFCQFFLMPRNLFFLQQKPRVIFVDLVSLIRRCPRCAPRTTGFDHDCGKPNLLRCLLFAFVFVFHL